MPEATKFDGTVVRVERDGFGIVKFDHPIGPSANTIGLVSSSTGTTVISGPGISARRHRITPRGLLSALLHQEASSFASLEPGTRVSGTAEVDARGVATVKTITSVGSSN